jgi:RNA-binding protein
MHQLNSNQKRQLKSMAHHLKPVVYIGKHGMSGTLMTAIDQALNDHELIKIKFVDFKDKKRDFIDKIGNDMRAEIISLIGNIATLFRPSNNEAKRKIVF